MDSKVSVFRTIKNQSGMSLAGLMVSIAILGILSVFISFSMFSMSRQTLHAANKRDQETTWFLTQRQLSRAVVNMDALTFRASRTFGPPTTPDVQHTRVDQHRRVFTNINGTTSITLIPDINPRNTITVIPADKLGAESSFLNSAVSSIMTPSGVPIYQDSFTLRRAEVKIGANADLVTDVRGIYGTRCLPIASTTLHSSGSTIDPAAPHKSAAYVFSYLNLVPYINSQRVGAGTRVWISCCPVGTPCLNDNLSQHFLRMYSATFSNGQLVNVDETPSVGETNTVWGMGFMLKFNHRSTPTRYDLILFSIRDLCKVLQADRCQSLNPLVVTKNISNQPGFYTDYLRRNFPIRPLLYSGTITPNLANSGVLRLTQ
jgi:type II secretory pathway pseudopilin PulG